jgi:DNA-directed RNA polymerase specialized sigma24 family protein
VSRNRLLTILRDSRDLSIPENYDIGIVDESILGFEDRDTIAVYLGTLPSHIRQIFELLMEGLSIKETSQVLGRKLNTTHVQHKRAAAKLCLERRKSYY